MMVPLRYSTTANFNGARRLQGIPSFFGFHIHGVFKTITDGFSYFTIIFIDKNNVRSELDRAGTSRS